MLYGDRPYFGDVAAGLENPRARLNGSGHLKILRWPSRERPRHSYRRASTGSSAAALRAGQ